MAAKLDLPRTEILAKLHHLSAQKSEESPSKTLSIYLRGAGEGTLGRLLVEMAGLSGADSAQAGSKILSEAAKEYSINVGLIGTAVSKEFADREKAKAAKETTAKPRGNGTKKTPAA